MTLGLVSIRRGLAVAALIFVGAAAHSEGTLPPLSGATSWVNSAPLTPAGLRGKVVLVDFWTYSCINCLRSLPYVKSWYERYKDHGLVIIGVHSPEFPFEKNLGNVKSEVTRLGIRYPVALDNDFAIWQLFNNQFWPAHYFIDARGQIRSHHFGEGDYEESEATIRKLLTEAGYPNLPAAGQGLVATGVEAAADGAHMVSPETYIGYERAENFVSPEGFLPDHVNDYLVPGKIALNRWALGGPWNVHKDEGVLVTAPGKIVFRFLARDLHLVLGPAAKGKPVRFRVRIDGQVPGTDRGMDVNEAGEGVVTEHRLYQLIRQSGAVKQHTFEIEFLDGGVHAYSFTFG